MTKIGCKRTTPKKGLKRKPPRDGVLDGLVRQYVYFISGGYCKRCKKRVGVKNIEAAHLFRRWRKTVRWDLRNVQPLCKDCHDLVDNDPIQMTNFMYDVLSKEDIADLQRLANMTIKDHPIDREQIKKDLQEKVKLMEGL